MVWYGSFDLRQNKNKKTKLGLLVSAKQTDYDKKRSVRKECI
jgi:hypothetical protein